MEADEPALVSSTFSSSEEHLGQRISYVGFHIPHANVLTECKEVLQDHNSVFGSKGFGMELNTPNRVFPVTDSHDLVLFGARGRFETFGKRSGFDHKRMVTGGGEGIGKICKEILRIMMDGRSFAVHETIGPDDSSAKGLSHALMPEADPKDGNLACETFD